MKHTLVGIPGGRIHVVEHGQGPLVLLVHGFPEFWFSWRHQLPALAEAGFRAAAIDVRGYGRSVKPFDVAAYRMLAHVADNVEVVRGLGADTATIVGHDWGAVIAANSALLRPDVFTAVGLLSVPYSPRDNTRPTEAFARAGSDEEFYVSYFQEPGRAEAEIEPDVRSWLAGVYCALSGDAPAGSERILTVAPGGTMRDRMPDAGTASALADQRRLRHLRLRVRTHWFSRCAQSLSQRRPRLGRSRRVEPSGDPPALDLHRGRARREVVGRRHPGTSSDAARSRLL